MRRLLAPVVLAVLAPSLFVGCKPKPAEKFAYTFRFPGPEAPERGTLMLGDVELGAFFPGGGDTGSQNDRTYGTAHVQLPRETLVWQHAKELSVRVATGCGVKKYPLRVADGMKVFPRSPNPKNSSAWSRTYEEAERAKVDKAKEVDRHYFAVEVPVDWEGAPPPPPVANAAKKVTLYVDRHLPEGTPSAKAQLVTIGSIPVPKGETHFAVDGLGCAPEHDVTVDGKVVGKLVVKPKAEAYVVSTEPACYRERGISYSSAKAGPVGGSSSFSHQGGVAYALTGKDVDYFLREAPRSVQGTGFSFVTEVTRVPCTGK